MWLKCSTGRERLLGTRGWGGGRKMGEREREREREQLYYSLSLSCFVTILEIMLPLFAKSFQTVCKTEL